MKKLTTEEFIKRANEIHKNKYNYSFSTYKGKRKNIEITCREHGKFNQNAGVHLNGSGCKRCHSDKMSKKNTLTTEEFIKKAKGVHKDKYNYCLVDYKNSQMKVKIICSEHGEFSQTPANHLFNHGCDGCARKEQKKNKTLTTEIFIKKAKKIHKNIYNYSKVEYKNNSTKVKILCPKHGEFKQSPNSHISAKNGCSHCSGKAKLTLNAFKIKAKKIHGNKYNYSLISEIKNSQTKIKIVCSKHEEFMQTPGSHLNQKQGCPRCCESKGERIVGEFLKEKKLIFDRQKTFDDCINPKTGRKLKFDFYLPKYNMCIEYDGRQHFEPIKRFGGEKGYNSTIYRDRIKNEFCVNNKIKIVRIKYNERILNKLKKITNECI
jgi:hypothetical protein